VANEIILGGKSKKITDLIISPASLGERLWLVDIQPAYEYGSDGRRTEKISGYRYVITLPDKQFEKVSVRIDGKKLLEKPDGYAEVRFTDLALSIFWSKNEYSVSCKATGIHLVNPKA